VFARHVDLPRGPEREIVRERKRSCELNGRESAALSTIAAFRVVQVSDVREMLDDGRGGRSAQKSLEHLQASGLLERIPLERRDEDVMVPTNRGRDLLEANRREHAGEPRQVFYAGLKKPRELTHDAQVYRACRDAEAQIRNQGSRVLRVVLDYEFKREYQQFLQERNRGRADSTGRPDRTPGEVAPGRRNTTCPTGTTVCVSPTRGLNSRTVIARASTGTSKSSRRTTVVPTPRPWPARAFNATAVGCACKRVDAVADAASIPGWPRS